jgi:quinol monooxygenase YgiN
VHARMGTLYTYPKDFAHVLQVLRDTVFPAAQRKPGFSGMLLMSDRQASKAIGITLWESEADMLASEDSEYLQEQVSKIITGLRRPPEFENYELEVL